MKMKRPTTVLSTKGQLILPKAVREQRHWGPGTRLVVEETAEGVLLKPAAAFGPTKPSDVYGCLRSGPPKSLDEMEASIPQETRRRHARNRY
jgi:AbrB family looped-hinge helix DNA binding protein